MLLTNYGHICYQKSRVGDAVPDHGGRPVRRCISSHTTHSDRSILSRTGYTLFEGKTDEYFVDTCKIGEYHDGKTG